MLTAPSGVTSMAGANAYAAKLAASPKITVNYMEASYDCLKYYIIAFQYVQNISFHGIGYQSNAKKKNVGAKCFNLFDG
jgi:hypothetical protein